MSNLPQLLQNPWFGFAGTVVGIIGVILSVIFYSRSRRFSRPSFLRTSMRWFDGSENPHSDLQLIFRGHPVRRFTITQLVFWNAGNEPIRPFDFAKASQLRLEMPSEFDLFDARITVLTAPETALTLGEPVVDSSSGKRVIPIYFDYVDGGDGFVAQIVHDGTSHRDIEVAGKLTGVQSFHKASLPYSLTSFRSLESRIEPALPLIQFVFAPMIMFSLGLVGAWSSCSYLSRIHWYQVPIAILTLFLLTPFIIFGGDRLPKKLRDAISAGSNEEAEPDDGADREPPYYPPFLEFGASSRRHARLRSQQLICSR